MIFLCYPKCSTCMKAKKHLNQLGLSFEERDISRENPDLDGEIFFNSAATAAAKTQFACDSKLGSVMLYHLLCDRTDEGSLIAACRTAIDPK